jgi:hypothetical protein
MIKFDHIEVHVKDAKKYVIFLKKLFDNGRYKKISENNTYMFISYDNIHIEIKESKSYKNTFAIDSGIGFCLPCLRMENAKEHLGGIDEIQIYKEIQNPDGPCFFFKDYEGIDWHFKSYNFQDKFINI